MRQPEMSGIITETRTREKNFFHETPVIMIYTHTHTYTYRHTQTRIKTYLDIIYWKMFAEYQACCKYHFTKIYITLMRTPRRAYYIYTGKKFFLETYLAGVHGLGVKLTCSVRRALGSGETENPCREICAHSHIHSIVYIHKKIELVFKFSCANKNASRKLFRF